MTTYILYRPLEKEARHDLSEISLGFCLESWALLFYLRLVLEASLRSQSSTGGYLRMLFLYESTLLTSNFALSDLVASVRSQQAYWYAQLMLYHPYFFFLPSSRIYSPITASARAQGRLAFANAVVGLYFPSGLLFAIVSAFVCCLSISTGLTIWVVCYTITNRTLVGCLSTHGTTGATVRDRVYRFLLRLSLLSLLKLSKDTKNKQTGVKNTVFTIYCWKAKKYRWRETGLEWVLNGLIQVFLG